MLEVDFYCRDCDNDYRLNAYREYKGEIFAARCKCGRKLIRLIKEKEKDPYFRLSLRLRRERQEKWRDLVQPSDSRFRLLYKKEWDKIEKANEEAEKREREEKKKWDAFYKAHKQNIVEKRLAKQIIQAEQKIAYGTNT